MKLFLYKNQRGFSIVEAVTAAVLLIIGVLFFFNIQGQQLIQFTNFRDLEKIEYSANGIFEELESMRSSSGPVDNYLSVDLLQTSDDQIVVNFQNLLNNTLGTAGDGDIRQLTLTASTDNNGNVTQYLAKIRIKKDKIDQELTRIIY
jgi:Tfp pilus assembly protein PilV